MTSNSTTPCLPQSESRRRSTFRQRVRPARSWTLRSSSRILQCMLEGELDMVLARSRYGRHAKPSSRDAEDAVGVTGHRHGHRSRSLLGTFGRVEIEVPCARLNTPDGKTTSGRAKRCELTSAARWLPPR